MTALSSDLMTPREVQAAFRISASTLRRWVERGLITAVELPNGRSRYYRAEINAVLTRGEEDS